MKAPTPQVLLGSLVSTLLVLAANADTITGTGWKGVSGNNFSTTANWDAAAPNTSGTGDRNLFFGQRYKASGGTATSPNNDLSNWHGYRITFQDSNAAGTGTDGSAANDTAFTITGLGFTNFDFGGNFPRVENDSFVTQTFSVSGLGMAGQNGGQKAEINPVNGDIVFSVGAKVNLQDTTQLQIFGNNGKTLTFNDVISSIGTNNSVAINGVSTVVYAATNTYGGDTFINKGTLRCATNDAAPAATFIRLGDTTGTVGANLNLDGGRSMSTKINVRNGSSGAKVIANTSGTTGTATFSGNLFLDNDVTLFANTGGVTLSGAILDLKNQTLIMDGTGTSTISGGMTNSTGSGKLTKNGNGTLTVSGVNFYTGATTVSAGKLLVNGSTASASAVTVQTTAILGGTGTVSGAVTVQSGGTLAPGVTIGTLTLGTAPTLGGTCLMEINTTNSPGTNDAIVLSSGTFAYGGTLTVTNTGPALNGGEVFRLFSAPAYSGSFSATNLPSLGAGQNWYLAQIPTNGSIIVNRSPTAADKTYGRTKDTSIKIPKSDLLSGASDPDSGDAVSYDAITSTGSQGASVTENSTTVFYNPVNNNGDILQYRLKDNRGGTVTKNITINVTNSVGTVSITNSGGGSMTIGFYGIPGFDYVIQRSPDLSAWTDVITNTTPADGLIQYTETPPYSPAYYRTRQP